MRALLFCLLPLASGLSLFAVSNGDALATVVAEKGEPNSKLERGNVTMLTYDDTTIRLVDGKVVSQTGATAAYATSAVQRSGAVSSSSSSPGLNGEWTTDYQSAIGAAQGSGRETLLFFTGSDWCGWCKRLEAEVLDTEEFKTYASGNLVLVKLDFPRRIAQSDFTKRRNRELAQKYCIGGYPALVVLNDSGEEVGRLGYQPGGPGPFIKKLRKL